MSRIHVFIVVLVALLVVGGSGWFVYKLYVQPQASLRAEQARLEEAKKVEAAAPDPAEVAYAAAVEQTRAAAPADVQAKWSAFLEKFPASPRAAEARAILGPLNMAALFAPGAEGQTVHTVAKGDSLYKIARQNGVTIDLLARANGLDTTMLRIGQPLVVPKTAITATVDRTAKTLRLENNGKFLRDYQLLAVNLPALAAGSPAAVKVSDAVVESGGKRVTFGQKGYSDGSRSIILTPPGGVLTGAPADTAEAQLPPGIVVKDTDLPEIFVLLTRGVPVTIP
jgi:hypothetical protein